MNRTPPAFLDDKLDPVPATRHPAYHLALIPYEQTTTYRRGTRNAPEAIVEASGHMEVYDETLRIDASTRGIETLRPAVTDLRSITTVARDLRERYPGDLLGFVGGEHSVTPAIVEGVRTGDMGVVWVDAHADLRKSYLGRGDNHACAAFNTLPFARIVQIGVRTLAEEEALLVDGSDRVKCFEEWGREARDALLGLPEDVYLTIDADGFAPEVVRAVGTPEPGGLYWREVIDIVATVFEHKNVIAFDTVELCPDEHDIASTFTIAKLVYKIISYHAYYK